MKRLKLQYGYHDALIQSVEYRDDEDVILGVQLCSCCNSSPGHATLTMTGVRNFAEVQRALESARQANGERNRIDEIIAVAKDDVRGYLLDLATAGAVHVDATGIQEA